MPWEIPIYICSRFAEALEQIYIPVWLPPPTLFGLEKGCTLDMYCVHIWIIRYHVYIWILYILYTRMDIVYIIYTYGYSIKTPPGGFRWKTEKNFE